MRVKFYIKNTNEMIDDVLSVLKCIHVTDIDDMIGCDVHELLMSF